MVVRVRIKGDEEDADRFRNRVQNLPGRKTWHERYKDSDGTGIIIQMTWDVDRRARR